MPEEDRTAADQSDVDEIVKSLDLEELDLNLYRGYPTYWEQVRLFGGTVAAQALSAAYKTVDEVDVHSLHSYFLLGGDPSIPVIYEVDRIRDGRSFTTRRVVARQRGRAIYNLAASFHKRESGFDHQQQSPSCSGPDEFPTPEDIGLDPRELFPHEWQTKGVPIELRLEIGPAQWKPGALGRQMWMRINGDFAQNERMNNIMLTYMSDLPLLGTAVRTHTVDSADVMGASLDHTMWFHRPVVANEWLLYDMRSPSAAGARGFNLGHFYDQAGILVASSAQEGLIRPLNPEAVSS